MAKVKMNKMDGGDWFMAGMLTAVAVVVVVLAISGTFSRIQITQETANEICYNITGIKGIVASPDDSFSLVCTKPTVDSTQNIIIKTNGDSDSDG